MWLAAVTEAEAEAEAATAMATVAAIGPVVTQLDARQRVHLLMRT